jgi:drug/metabolite transporter (DMT)-like permease
MALVGTYVGLSRWLVVAFPVCLLAWLRFGIAAVAMAGWLRRGVDESPLSAPDQRRLFWGSLLGNFLFSISMLYGVAATSAVAAGVVMAALPGAVAVLSAVFLREHIGLRVGGGIGCAVAGIALLALARQGTALDPTLAAHAPWWGYALLVVAVWCEASYVVIGKRLTAQVAPRRISAGINLWGLVLITPFGLWQARHFDFAAVAAGAWGLLFFYALAASVVSVWLWMRGLRQVPAPQAGVFAVLLPVSAAAVGVLVLHEPFGASQAAAMALALTGLLLAAWPPQGEPANPANPANPV